MAQQYPTLQISVPVHADEWADGFVPKVTFVPQELDDTQESILIAYEGNKTKSVNSRVVPDNPVVVIGDNERMENPDDIIHTRTPIMINNWALQGAQTQSGIRLQWTYTYQGSETIIGYKIYRKSVSNNNFIYLGESTGVNNRTFDDNSTVDNAWYNYYVVATAVFGQSNSSNIVNILAPDRPLSVVTFNADVYGPSEIGTYWTYPATQFVDYMSLSKRIINRDNDFIELHRFTNNDFDFVDAGNNAGNKIIYRTQIVSSSNSFSNPKYDIVKVPYRNISIPTKLYINRIELDDVSDVEPWIRGAPEFIVSVIKGAADSPHYVHKKVYLQFDSRTNSQDFNKRLADWLPDNWMEMYTFTMVEDDPATWSISMSFNVGYQKKDSAKLNILTNGVGFTIDDLFGANDDEIGEAYLRFTDKLTTTLRFPDSSNTKIKVSDHIIN